jgi:cation:H+ antiporter
MPELLVSVRAALADAPGIALGNVIGSNIANILLIIGVSALIAPIAATNSNSKRDVFVMSASSIALMAMLLGGSIGLVFGLLMFFSLIAYLVTAYLQDRGAGSKELELEISSTTKGKILVLIASGLILLAGGADLLVRGATQIATDFGVSNAVIGLTVVAVGTSLPELATSITAALKRRSDIAIGNVIGSNIFNILGILGITAIISPINVSERFQTIDGWVLLATTMVFAVILLIGKGLGRFIGCLYLAAYAAYMITMS